MRNSGVINAQYAFAPLNVEKILAIGFPDGIKMLPKLESRRRIRTEFEHGTPRNFGEIGQRSTTRTFTF